MKNQNIVRRIMWKEFTMSLVAFVAFVAATIFLIEKAPITSTLTIFGACFSLYKLLTRSVAEFYQPSNSQVHRDEFYCLVPEGRMEEFRHYLAEHNRRMVELFRVDHQTNVRVAEVHSENGDYNDLRGYRFRKNGHCERL